MYGITVTYQRGKTERLQLERLNLFVAHLCTNDYVSTYQQLLNKTGMRAVFQTVLHNRIHLAFSANVFTGQEVPSAQHHRDLPAITIYVQGFTTSAYVRWMQQVFDIVILHWSWPHKRGTIYLGI